ncbi:Protein serine/threonine phosphatase [alpha proteobacterium BAL199]|nr:Protein serine/threonine phosphatase [alpha proteobacterium BAL199]
MAGLNPSYSWRSAALSHCGQRHQENQDSCLDRPDLGLWAVADGMGGHADGHIASRTLCRDLGRITAQNSLISLARAVDEAIAATNSELFHRGAAVRPSVVIGTTAAVLVAHSGYVMCVWCGDSRIHLIRDGEAFLLTRDHTPVQEMLDRGEIDRAAAKAHRASHMVSRAVGVTGVADIDRLAIEAQAGDRFMLCTDGISRHVAVDELADFVDDDPEHTVRRIVDLAQARGATDDVTAIAVNLSDREPPS